MAFVIRSADSRLRFPPAFNILDELILLGPENYLAKTDLSVGVWRHCGKCHNQQRKLKCFQPTTNQCPFTMLTLHRHSESEGVSSFSLTHYSPCLTVTSCSNLGFIKYALQLITYGDRLSRFYGWETECLTLSNVYEMGEDTADREIDERVRYASAKTVLSYMDFTYGCVVCGAERFEIPTKEDEDFTPCHCNFTIAGDFGNGRNSHPHQLTKLPNLMAIEAIYCKKGIVWESINNYLKICVMDSRHYHLIILINLRPKASSVHIHYRYKLDGTRDKFKDVYMKSERLKYSELYIKRWKRCCPKDLLLDPLSLLEQTVTGFLTRALSVSRNVKDEDNEYLNQNTHLSVPALERLRRMFKHCRLNRKALGCIKYHLGLKKTSPNPAQKRKLAAEEN